MRYNIHLERSTGKITSWGTAVYSDDDQSHFPDHEITHIEFNGEIDPKIHKMVACPECGIFELVEKTIEEKAKAILPTIFDVKCAIFSELIRTDALMLPDRSTGDDQRKEWQEYRQTLRDLSKLGTSTEMIDAWPDRPDGESVIVELRERLQASILLLKSASKK